VTSEAVLAALRAEPFIPFRMRLASGDAILVDRPERISCVAGRQRAVVLGANRSIEVLELASVVGLEFFEPERK
jgi:hypothetical protein